MGGSAGSATVVLYCELVVGSEGGRERERGRGQRGHKEGGGREHAGGLWKGPVRKSL